MAIQTEARRLALRASRRPQLDLWLVGWLQVVLLYTQLIRPMMDYACPIWRAAARSHIKKLQVLQSKCLRIATNAPWYVGNKQIHDDLGVPYISDHIRSLTERFDSKLADVGNPLFGQLGRHSR
jgi:hypothetical protein